MIAIIDYQMGNLRSVQKAFEKVGFAAEITSDPHQIERADKVVLPGVGAFRDAIAELKRRELVQPIKDAIDSNKPFLGICLGLQLLFDVSYEDGQYEGLGVVAGEVVRFDLPREYKIPHMGWNQVKNSPTNIAPLEIADGSSFYFVHSYYVVPEDKQIVALTADYGGDFCAAIARDHLFASQFHPEKSQAVGLKLLENFAQLQTSVA
jgi:glutamine amidotransferase